MVLKPSSAKSGLRWSIVGKSMARRTRSGTLVGPGICRKWRPAALAMRYSTRGLMNAPSFPIRVVSSRVGDGVLAHRLKKEIDGEVLFDSASRGRYSTDASIYQ